ncbi:MAG: hypothetical protein ACI8QC_002989 [Planctomycetota bacterium]|jgi:hypothetical protein
MNDSASKTASSMQRHLSSLKVISRLLGHELHIQSTAKAITLSRDEMVEIQTTLDLFIEECARQGGFSVRSGAGIAGNTGSTTLVPTRN